jgi:hypothetical protein
MKQIILAAVITVGACGGGEPVHEGTVNPAGARMSVESMSDVFAALDGANGEDAANAIVALTAAGQIVVTPGQELALPPPAFMPSEWPRTKSRLPLTGSAECTESGCTFVDFGDDTPSGSYRINGSIQRTGDTLVFDLTYDITSSELVFHWRMDGSLTVTPSLIDGEIHSSGDARLTHEGEDYEVGWDFDIDYDRIGLDGTGCPVSGGLSATVAYSVSGAQSGSYRAAASLRFGPTCGQYQTN